MGSIPPASPIGYPAFTLPVVGPVNGVPPYPGTAAVNSNPAFQYNPSFDGFYAHGLTNNPYSNSLFEDVNALQTQIYASNGLGYPTSGPGFPPGGPAPTGPPPGTGGNVNHSA